MPIVKDNFGIRRITPLECLVLQSFPDNFAFPENIPERELYKQAGNTVCVSMIKHLIKRLDSDIHSYT